MCRARVLLEKEVGNLSPHRLSALLLSRLVVLAGALVDRTVSRLLRQLNLPQEQRHLHLLLRLKLGPRQSHAPQILVQEVFLLEKLFVKLKGVLLAPQSRSIEIDELLRVARIVVGAVEVLKFVLDALVRWHWRKLSQNVSKTAFGERLDVLFDPVLESVV